MLKEGGYSLPIILVLVGVIFFSSFAVTTDRLEHLHEDRVIELNPLSDSRVHIPESLASAEGDSGTAGMQLLIRLGHSSSSVIPSVEPRALSGR